MISSWKRQYIDWSRHLEIGPSREPISNERWQILSLWQEGIRVNCFLSGGYLPELMRPRLLQVFQLILVFKAGPQFPNTTTKSSEVDTNMTVGIYGCLFNIKKTHMSTIILSPRCQMCWRQCKQVERVSKTLFDPDQGKAWKEACETALDKYGGFWGPFLILASYNCCPLYILLLMNISCSYRLVKKFICSLCSIIHLLAFLLISLLSSCTSAVYWCA